MTQSTGGGINAEVTNYQTARATLTDMIGHTEVQIDAANGALGHLADVKIHVDAFETALAGVPEAAASKLDHMSALNVDGTTLGHAGAQVENLPAGSVNTLYEAVEVIETAVADRAAKAADALAAEQAELANIDSLYGEAAATVEEKLAGDSRFVGSGGAAAAH